MRRKYLEYLETKLTVPLLKDKEYLIEFYISRADKSLSSIKEFGVLFSSINIWGLTSRGISEKPQVIFSSNKGYKSKKEWIKLSAVYKAEGNEAFLILGHFNYNPTDNKPKIRCHYYIDDVTITPIEKKSDSTSTVILKELSFDQILPKLGEIVTLKNIFFQTNKSELLPESFNELDRLASYLSETPNTLITIIGNTDNTGNEEKNRILSEARAKAVAEYLTSKNIDKSRIKYTGYGSSKPIASNDTEEGKQQNRRVEFIISSR
jgi:outer membrane protein OmpA-like peptidoglycan-associated protein